MNPLFFWKLFIKDSRSNGLPKEITPHIKKALRTTFR